MDDEIDIEEHDLLEDPRLHDIFPDISQIKVERPDDEYDDQSMDCDPYQGYDAAENQDENLEESEEYTRYGNKIILGTKPTAPTTKVRKKLDNENCVVFGTETVNIKQEPQDSDTTEHVTEENVGTTENSPVENDENSQSSTVIIVGSKPCKTGVIEPITERDIGTVEPEPNLAVDRPADGDMEQNNEDIDKGEEDCDIKDSVVLLENWGPKLQNSPCFCKECEILFPTTNTLHAHNNIAHSLLVVVDKNKAVKSTAKKHGVTNGKFCNHCNTMFPNSDSLINHLYENMTLNKNSQTFKTPSKPATSTPKANSKPSFNKSFEAKTPQNTVPSPKIIENKPPDSETTISHKYRCMLCSEIFLNYKQARSHRISKHVEMSGHILIQKLTFPPKGSSANNTVPVPKHTSQGSSKSLMPIAKPSPSKLPEISPSKLPEGISQALVPMSVLFKCYKCSIHFTACYPAMQHLQNCPRKRGEWVCEICHKQFKSWARVMHNLQHKYSDKFTVYIINEHILGKVMNKCPDCNTYLYEKDFLIHRSTGQPCEKKRVFKCGTCTLSVHHSSAKQHMHWHEKIDMGFSDMILVNFIKTDEVKVATGPVKRTLQMDDASAEIKKTKIESELKQPHKMVVFYCSTCNACLFNARYKELHVSGQCQSITLQRVICKTCGLVCHNSHAYNKACHKVKGNLMQMTFRSIHENKPICPPMPIYPKCNKCQVHFCSEKSVMSHDCNESHKTCKYCSEKFSDLAYKLHVRYHLFLLQFSGSMSVVPSNLPRPTKVNVSKIKGPITPKKATMPDLLKKYQMLTSGLHILYLCETCDVTCDYYDNAVEHCQKHYNKMESYDVILNSCEVCGLKFDSNCYDRHIALHNQDKSINQSSFHIVKYDYNNLFSKGWPNILGELPAAQAKRILDTSIYRYGKSIKLRIVEEGPPEATIYICRRCNKVISPVMLICHYRSLACSEDNKIKCRHCGRDMATTKTKAQHEQMHAKYSKFQVVYFNEEGDEEFNKNLKKHDTSRTETRGFQFFQCEQCECVMGPTTRFVHRCGLSEQLLRCSKCQMYFHYRSIKRHFKLHAVYPNFSRKNMKLTPFKPTTVDSPKPSTTSKYFTLPDRSISTAYNNDADLYKCKCGLHFTNRKAAEKHLPLCKKGTSETSKEKCSKCGLLFDTTQLVAHLCKHHSKDNANNTKFKVLPLREYCEVNCNGYTLHKCLKCNIHFTSSRNVKLHLIQNHPKQMTLPCPQCKLIFRPKTLTRHIAKHHRSGKPQNKNIQTMKTVVPKPSLKIIKPQNMSAKILRNKYGKSLYQCKECKQPTYFMCAFALRSHYTRKRHDIPTEKCDICHYSFVSGGSSFKMHKQVHHTIMKLKRRDFVVKVPGRKKRAASTTSEEASQSSADDEPEPDRVDTPVQQPKSRALARKSTTKSIVPNVATTKDVRKSMEVNVPMDTSDIDNIVEYGRNASSSKGMDDDGRQKYNFFNVLFKCEICSTHFLTENKANVKHFTEVHVKNVPPAVCFCGLTVSKRLLSRHQQMHHQKLNLTADDFYIIPVNRYEDKNGHSIVGHKHLFRCSVCKLNHMHLNRLEDHLAEVEHNSGNCRCPKCHLAFLSGSLASHIALHHDILDLSLEDYVVMESVGNDCIALADRNETKTTPEIMPSVNVKSASVEKIKKKAKPKISLATKRRSIVLPNISEQSKKMIQQLAETSVEEAAKEYLKHIQGRQFTGKESDSSKITRNVMNLYKNTLYKCYHCDTHYLYSAYLKEHVRTEACNQETVACIICGLKFADNNLCKHVKFQHQVLKLAREDIVIKDSRFCLDNDSSIVSDTGESQEESEKDDISVLSKDDSVSTVSKEDGGKSMYFQCTKCLCNFFHRKTLTLHAERCNENKKTYDCPICEIRFTQITFHKHLKIEHNNISYAEALSQSQKNSPWLQKESDVKNSSQSDELSATQQYLSRFITKDNFYHDLNPEYFTRDLFKCKFCPLHFFSAKNLRRHINYYKNEEHDGCDVETCKLCELNFNKKILPKHIYIHHVKLNISRDDYRIIKSDDDLYKSILAGKTSEEPLTDTSMDPLKDASRNDCSVSQDDSISGYADEPREISDKISTLNVDLYSNKLFRCSVCELHFLTSESLQWHIKNAQHGIQKTHCTSCGLAFTVKTLPTHVYIHHEKLRLMREHYHIHNSLDDETCETNEISKNTNQNTTKTLEKNVNASKDNISLRKLLEQTVDLKSSSSKQLETSACSTDTLKLSVENITENAASSPVAPEVVCEVVESADSTNTNHKDAFPEPAKDTPSPNSYSLTTENMKAPENNDKLIKLYKCADCNVCFLNQTICYKHVVKHTPLDAKDYIECKLCGYQFMIINSLHKHIWKHHNRVFKPEDVLIEEYHPNILVHGTPKIEIYYGSDKVQSKLVSTTSEGTATIETADDSTTTVTINEDVAENENDVKDVEEESFDAPENSENIVADVVDELSANMDVDLTNASIIFDE